VAYKKSEQQGTLGKGKEEDMKTRKLKKLKTKQPPRQKLSLQFTKRKKSTHSKEAANSH
jgi:hypothetical protein